MQPSSAWARAGTLVQDAGESVEHIRRRVGLSDKLTLMCDGSDQVAVHHLNATDALKGVPALAVEDGLEPLKTGRPRPA
jgi:hypothetical protein